VDEGGGSAAQRVQGAGGGVRGVGGQTPWGIWHKDKDTSGYFRDI